MATRILIPAVAGVAALAVIGGATAASALHKNDVTLVVDGVATSMALREDTVGEVLRLQGVTLGEHDVVLPAADTRVSDGLQISVAFGRPLQVSVDGEKREVWTTARSVGDALRMLNLDAPDSKLSASRSQGIGREGLNVAVATAQQVSITAAGATTSHRVAGTVHDALEAAGITPDADDKVSPAAPTRLTDGLAITVVDVEVKDSTKTVTIDFDKTTNKSDKLFQGEKKVTTKGVAGEKVETYTDVYEDGVLVSSTLATSSVMKPGDRSHLSGYQGSAGWRGHRPRGRLDDLQLGQGPEPRTRGHVGSDRRVRVEQPLEHQHRQRLLRRSPVQPADVALGQRAGDFAAYPHQASRAEQITVANRLYAKRGTQPWSCA